VNRTPHTEHFYDIIGDVHGHAQELEGLLKLMDYSNETGVWSHSYRRAIFVGDFINRGPNSREVIRLIRDMVKAGSALAILGNHEINAILYFTRNKDGKSLRVPSSSNRKLLDQLSFEYHNQYEWLEKDIKWLRSLPIYLKLNGIRVVHAYWNDVYIRFIDKLYEDGRLRKKTLKEIIKKESPYYLPFNQTIKGIEFNLPKDLILKDDKNIQRTSFRVKWWENPFGQTFKSLSYESKFQLPAYSIPKQIITPYHVYQESDPLVFIGHYCMGNGPMIPAPNICCVDACISSSGRLAAYRYNGESKLNEDNFIFIKKIPTRL